MGRWIIGKFESRISRLAIEITNICNASCRFCAYRYLKRPKYILPTEKFKFFLDKYVEYGGGELKLTPIVGDPLVDKDLITKIKLAKETGVITNLYTYTNLIGLNNFDIREFLLSGINRIDISVCIGNRKMYRKLFGTDSYDLVMDNLRKLLEENRRLDNEVKIGVILRCDKPYNKIRVSADYKEITKLLGKEPRAVENYDNWTGLIKKEDLPKGQEFRQVEEMSEPCSLLYKGVIVFPNGDVGICWCRDLEATLIVGNLYKQSLDEIWRGDKLKKMRKDWFEGKVPEICKKCYQYTSLSEFIDERSKL